MSTRGYRARVKRTIERNIARSVAANAAGDDDVEYGCAACGVWGMDRDESESHARTPEHQENSAAFKVRAALNMGFRAAPERGED